MARPRKIKRHTKIYRSRRRRPMPSWLVTLIILVFSVLVGMFCIGPITDLVKDYTASRDSSDQSESDSSAPSDSSESPSSSEASSETSSETSSEPASSVEGNMLLVTADQFADQASFANLLTQAKADGVQSIVLELKNDTGKIAYATANQDAVDYEAVTEDAPTLSSLVSAIEQAGMRPIASIHTLKDPTAAHSTRKNCYLYGETDYTWLDDAKENGGKAWLDPYTSQARTYLKDLAEEIAQAGFTDLILQSVQFPDGTMSGIHINDSTVSRQDILAQLIDEIAQTVQPHGCQVITQWRADAFLMRESTIYDGSPQNIVSDSDTVLIDFSTLSADDLADAFPDTEASEQLAQAWQRMTQALPKAIPAIDSDWLAQWSGEPMESYLILE